MFSARFRALLPGLGLLCAALVYLGFPSWDWYFDGLTFAMGAEGVAGGGDPAWLLHPHHLLYGPAAFAFWRLLWTAGLTVRAWLAMSWLSTACALAALVVFHRLLRRTQVPAAPALAAAALLACAHGFWQYATQGDTTMPETLLLLALVAVATAPGAARAADAALLGVLLAAATLVHQTSVLVVPAAAWAVWRRAGRRAAPGLIVRCLGIAGIVVTTVYAAAGALFLRPRTVPAFLAWLAGYFGADPRTGYAPGYGSWHASALLLAPRGAVESVLGPGHGAIWATAALALAVAAVGLAAVGARRALTSGAPARRLLVETWGIFLVAHAVFFTWWKPGHARFWVLALPGWVALAAMGLGAKAGPGRRRDEARSWWWLPAAVAVGVMAFGPFRREASPAFNRFLPVAEAVAAATGPATTVAIAGVGSWGALKAYLPYVARRPMLILDWQFADKGIPPAHHRAALRTRLEGLAAGGRLAVLSDVLDPALDEHFATVHGVSATERRALFSGLGLARRGTPAPGLDLLAPAR